MMTMSRITAMMMVMQLLVDTLDEDDKKHPLMLSTIQLLQSQYYILLFHTTLTRRTRQDTPRRHPRIKKPASWHNTREAARQRLMMLNAVRMIMAIRCVLSTLDTGYLIALSNAEYQNLCNCVHKSTPQRSQDTTETRSSQCQMSESVKLCAQINCQ